MLELPVEAGRGECRQCHHHSEPIPIVAPSTPRRRRPRPSEPYPIAGGLSIKEPGVPHPVWMSRSVCLAVLQPAPSAPLCQEEAEITFLCNVFGLLEELGREDDVGVEDLDADEAVVLPVEGDEGFDAGGCRGRRVVRPGVSASSVSSK